MASMKTEERNGEVWMDCAKCGKMFHAFDSDNDFSAMMETLYSQDEYRKCPSCSRLDVAERERIEAEERKKEFAENIHKIAAESIPELYRLDRMTGKPFVKAPVQHVANWIDAHRYSNLLISGKTGVGKSTSACFVALKIIAEHLRVRYVKLRGLLSEWRDARTSGEYAADKKFFSKIGRLDLLIVDEVADKNKNTDSGQEMMYELLDMIADGEIKTKLWMLGNFREGVLADVFGETEPVYRRIEENFVCVGANANEMKVFHVWGKTTGEKR